MNSPANDCEGQTENKLDVNDDANTLESPETTGIVTTDAVSDTTSEPCDEPSNPINKAIHPPPSKIELLRDRCLEILGGEAHNWIALIVLILVVIDGAFFFFLLIGAHNMCDTPSRTDCDPRNWWYNFSIQFLNVLFTYLAIVSLPWKLAHAAHLLPATRSRSCNVGLDLYGQPSNEIWYHICPKRRRWMVGFLLVNSLTQYANQVTRIVYYNYNLQNTYPGVLWTNLFFVLSFACAGVAGLFQLREETLLRKQRPQEFPPGPVEIAKKYLETVMCTGTKRLDEDSTGVQEDSAAEDLEDPRPLPEREENERRRCFHRVHKWFLSNRTSLDMWGL